MLKFDTFDPFPTDVWGWMFNFSTTETQNNLRLVSRNFQNLIDLFTRSLSIKTRTVHIDDLYALFHRLTYLKSLIVNDCLDLDTTLSRLTTLTQVQALKLLSLPKNIGNQISKMPNITKIDLTGSKNIHFYSISSVTQVTSLNLQNTSTNNDLLIFLTGLTKLKTLNLISTAVGDTGLGYLTHFTQLCEIKLNNKNISDVGLSHLSGMHDLHTLHFSGKVTDMGLCSLARYNKLTELNLYETLITPEGLDKYLSCLTKLTYLDLSHYNSDLQVSHYNSNPNILDLAVVSKLTNLSQLALNGVRLSVPSLFHLSSLKKLSFSCYKNINNQARSYANKN